MMKPIVDVSQWQGEIDYPLLISKTSGVIIRAGTGVQEDLRFQANYNGLSQHPGDIGAYWFVWSGINGAHQAEAFDAVIGSRHLDFLVMDAEENGAGLSQSALRARYKLFIDTFEALRPDAEIVIYTRASFWGPNIGIAGWEKYYRLWVAHYGVNVPYVPQAWDGIYWLHQYSADGNNLGAAYGVESDDIDLNRINPALIPPDPEPDPDPTPPGSILMRVVTSGSLNVRTGPGTGFSVVGTLASGSVVDVTEIDSVSPSSVWARHSAGWSAVVHGGIRYMDGTL